MISNTSSTHGTPPPQLPLERSRKAPASVPTPTSESLSTSSAESLRAALAASPEIRPEMIEHGEKLAVDANYPPRTIIEDIARQIVDSSDLSTEE